MRPTSRNIIQSFAVMVLSFAGIWFLKLGLLLAGSWLSSLNGQVVIEGLFVTVNSTDWSIYQVLAVYLLPILILILLVIVLGRKYHYPGRLSKAVVLLKSWLYLFLIIEAFLMPAISIFIKTGIWHPLNWLGFTLIEQYLCAVVLLIFYIIGSLKLGPFFAAATENSSVLISDKKSITNQVLSLVVIPAIGLIIFILAFTEFSLDTLMITYLAGLIFSVAVTVLQIVNYNVIVK